MHLSRPLLTRFLAYCVSSSSSQHLSPYHYCRGWDPAPGTLCSQQGSGQPPDLAQTVIPANQHTSQQCPEVLLELQHPADSKGSCKQSVICLCLGIKCLCGGLSAHAGQRVFIRGLYMEMGACSGQSVYDTQLNEPPQQATLNPLIRLMCRSPQLTSSSDAITAFLHLSFLFVLSSLNYNQEIPSGTKLPFWKWITRACEIRSAALRQCYYVC